MPTTPVFQSIALVGKPDPNSMPNAVREVIDVAKSLGIRVTLEAGTADVCGTVAMQAHEIVPYDKLAESAELIVSLGGDGTLLGIARRAVLLDRPLAGVNLGSLGFLTDIPANQIRALLSKVLLGEYIEEHRAIIAGSLTRSNESVVLDALAVNDVVVARGVTASLIELSVSIGGEFAYSMRADGLIVSTPTGSTAYSMSAGGPILHPALSVLTLVPIAPQTLSNRPVVVPADSTIELSIIRAQNAIVNFDTQTFWEVKPGDKVTLRKHPHAVRLLHPIGYKYYGMLRDKLAWNTRTV
jgi:NAD+ kinase